RVKSGPQLPSTATLYLLLGLAVLGLLGFGLLGLGLDAEGFLSLVVPVKVLTNFLAYVSTSSVNTLALSLFVPKPNSTNLYVIPALAVRLTLARLLRPLTPACPLWLYIVPTIDLIVSRIAKSILSEL